MNRRSENNISFNDDSDGENEYDDEIQFSQTSQATEPILSTQSSQSINYDPIEFDEIDELFDEIEQGQEQEPPLTPTQTVASTGPLETLALVASSAIPAGTSTTWTLSNTRSNALGEGINAMGNNTGMSPGVDHADIVLDGPEDTPVDASTDDPNRVNVTSPSGDNNDNDHENNDKTASARDQGIEKGSSDSKASSPSPSRSSSKNSNTATNPDETNDANSGTDERHTPRATTPPAPATTTTFSWPDSPEPDRDNTSTPKPSQPAQTQTKNSWEMSEEGSGTATSTAKNAGEWGSTGNTTNKSNNGASSAPGWGTPEPDPSTNTSGTNEPGGWGDSGKTGSSRGNSNSSSSTNPGGSGNWGGWGESSGSGSWSSPTKSQGRDRGNVTGANTTGIGSGAGSGWGKSAGSGSNSGFGAGASSAAPGLLPPMGKTRPGASNRDGGWSSRRGKLSDGPYAGAVREHRRQRVGGSLDSQQGAWGSGSGFGAGNGGGGGWDNSGGGWEDDTPAFTGNFSSTTTPQKNANINFSITPSPSTHLNPAYTPDLHFSVITRDMSSFMNQIKTNLDKIMEFQLLESNAKQELELAAKGYQTRKRELKAYLELEDDKAKKVKLLQNFESFKEEETRKYNSLVGSVHVAKLASKDAIGSGLKTMAQIINEEIQIGVLNTLRLIGTGTSSGSAGAPVDVSAVLGEMLKVAAPQIVKKFMNDIDEQCQPRVNALAKTIKAKETEVSQLTKRIDECRAHLFNLEQMLPRVEAAMVPVVPQPAPSQDKQPQIQDQIQHEDENDVKPIIPGNGIDAPIEISDDETDAMES